jgi:hypothetical protein
MGIKTQKTNTKTLADKKLKNSKVRTVELNLPKYSKALSNIKALNKMPTDTKIPFSN